MSWEAFAPKAVKIAIPLAMGALLLSSCISISEKLTINTDGSGVLDLNYHIARLVNDLPQPEGFAPISPLPTNPLDLQSAVQRVPGLTLESFTPEQNPQTVGARAVIRFDTVNSLTRTIGDFAPPNMTLTAAGALTTFTQTLYQGNPNGVSPKTLKLVERLFADYRLVFTLQAPRPIQMVSIGSIAADKNTATYTTTVPDIIRSTTPVVWEVSW